MADVVLYTLQFLGGASVREVMKQNNRDSNPAYSHLVDTGEGINKLLVDGEASPLKITWEGGGT